MISVRASSTPLAMICPGSLHADHDVVRISQGGAAASLGTAAHLAARSLVETGSIDWSNLPAVPKNQLEDLALLCAMAKRLWADVRDSFPGARTEVPLSMQLDGLLVTGTTDILSVSGSTVRLADWKFGYNDHDYSAQLKTYGSLALLTAPELTQGTSTILWVRDRQTETYTLGQASASDWMQELRDRIVNWDGVYRSGPHCEWCPRSHCCEAQAALARRNIAAFLEERASAELATMKPEAIIDLLDAAKMAARYAEAAQKAIKALVLERGDIVTESHRLAIRDEERRKLKPIAAFEMLYDRDLTNADFAECMKISVSKAESIIAKRAPKRGGAAAVRSFRDDLERLDAVTNTTIQKLVKTRA